MNMYQIRFILIRNLNCVVFKFFEIFDIVENYNFYIFIWRKYTSYFNEIGS
jgi:hypothetical protein